MRSKRHIIGFMDSMRPALHIGFVLYFLLFGVRAKAILAEEPKSTEHKGVRVEITPADGRASYTAALLNFNSGVLDLQLDGGERRSEQALNIKSLRFVPLPVAVLPQPPASTQTEKRAPWTPADSARFRVLSLKEHENTATTGEDDEYKKLRERAPALALLNSLTPIQRLHMADRVARTEYNHGRLNDYIASTQRRLRKAVLEEEAAAEMWMLACCYRQAGSPKIGELLREDAASIANMNIRIAMVDRVPDIVETLRRLRLEKIDIKK